MSSGGGLSWRHWLISPVATEEHELDTSCTSITPRATPAITYIGNRIEQQIQYSSWSRVHDPASCCISQGAKI
jgi:hypothetical protein